ncbi:MAG: hypothetical protein M1816_002854 [Peltula sp. TS41687]|nr:MAG: hypothetical protein M1816_002854 [Peltula sp. TS41687]
MVIPTRILRKLLRTMLTLAVSYLALQRQVSRRDSASGQHPAIPVSPVAQIRTNLEEKVYQANTEEDSRDPDTQEREEPQVIAIFLWEHLIIIIIIINLVPRRYPLPEDQERQRGMPVEMRRLAQEIVELFLSLLDEDAPQTPTSGDNSPGSEKDRNHGQGS